MPAITVFMPVYNARRFIAEAVESILAQSFSDFEFIIIDDGSTDGVLPLLQRYAQEDSRIRLISRPNRGIAATRNEGVTLATAPLIALLDADDVAQPERLGRQLAYMQHHSKVVALGSQALLIDADGRPICHWAGTRYTHEDIDRELMLGGWPIVNSTHMMRTEAVRAVGGYRDYQTSEDHDLYLRLAEIGRLANIHDTLVHYRVHLASNVHNRDDESRATIFTILAEARARRGLPPFEDKEITVPQRLSHLDGRRNWAWWALRDGYLATARKYALQVLLRTPLSGASWRLMACVMRGY